MAVLTFRVLTHWPAGRPRVAAVDQRGAPFRAAYEATAKELERELAMVGAANTVVQIDLESASELMRDGSRPRLDARLRSSAVVLTFQKQILQASGQWIDVPVTFACDRFVEWQDNLRAIVLGMEALRRVERYGITSAGEQYRGFAALPSSTTPAINTEQAAEVIARRAGSGATPEAIIAKATIAREYVRAVRAKAHPDAGGSGADFNLVQEAARVLGLHHGVTL